MIKSLFKFTNPEPSIKVEEKPMKNITDIKLGETFYLVLNENFQKPWNKDHWFFQSLMSHYNLDTKQFILPVKKEKALNFSYHAQVGKKSEVVNYKNLNLSTESYVGLLDQNKNPMDGNLWHLISHKMNVVRNSLKDTVIGQEQAVESLIAALINFELSLMFAEEKKPSLLITGPSGSGKSELMRWLPGYYNTVFFDCSNLTAAGYKGTNVEDLVRLIKQEKESKPHLPLIVFLDEMDKLSLDRGDNSTNKVTQANLLKIIEGMKYQLPVRLRGGEEKMEMVDTTDVMFVCAGAFSHAQKPTSELSAEDFISLGVVTELLGRMTHVTYTKPLTKEVIRKIILESKTSAYKVMKERLKVFNVELRFSEELINYLVDSASSHALGARVLKQEVEKIMLPYWSNLTPHLNKELVVTLPSSEPKVLEMAE